MATTVFPTWIFQVCKISGFSPKNLRKERQNTLLSGRSSCNRHILLGSSGNNLLPCMPHTHCFQGPWVFDNCPWLPASLVTASPVAKFVLRSGDLPSQKTHIVPENRPGPTRKFPLLPTISFQGQAVSFREGTKTKIHFQTPQKLRPEGFPGQNPFLTGAVYLFILIQGIQEVKFGVQ